MLSEEEFNKLDSTQKSLLFDGLNGKHLDESSWGVLPDSARQDILTKLSTPKTDDIQIGTASVTYHKPQDMSVWRGDGATVPAGTEAKYNISAVGDAPELFKSAPDSVKADAASGLVNQAIEKDNTPPVDANIFAKAMGHVNGILQKFGFAADNPLHPSSNDIADTAKESENPAISQNPELTKKLDQLKSGFSDDDLITAKKIDNPSRQKMYDEFITHSETPTYTPEDLQRYSDNIHQALDGRYDIKLMKDANGHIVPTARLAGDTSAEYEPLEGKGLWQDLKTSFVASLPIAGAQTASGMAMEKYAEPTAEALAALPSVWGKIASTALRGAAFGAGAYLATPAGVAYKDATNGATWNSTDFARETAREQSDSVLADTAVGGAATVYQAVKPIIPSVAEALGKFGQWSAGRLVDGNSPSIDNTFGKYGIDKAEVESARSDRARFQEVESSPPMFETPEFMQKIPLVNKIVDAIGNLKAPWIDAKRADALDTAMASQKLHGEIVRAAEEFPTKSRVFADNVEMMDHSIMSELEPMLNDSLEIRTKNELTRYTKDIYTNYGAMKDTWSYIFPEELNIKAISGLENEMAALKQSISTRDQAGAAQIEKIIATLDNGNNINDLISLRQDINYLLSKPSNSWNLDVALRSAKENIDTSMESMAKSLNKDGHNIGDELWANTTKAVADYREMKTLQDSSPMFRRITTSTLQPQEFTTLLYKYANQIDADTWRPILAKLSPETMEELENSAIARIVGSNYDKKIGVIDWTAVGEKLSTLKSAAFETESAQQNLATLKAASEQFWLNKDIHEAARNAAVRTPSGGIGTEILNKMEFFIMSRWFKRAMMYMPYDASRASAFRYQIGEAMATQRTPLKVIAKLQSYSDIPAEVKQDMKNWLRDITDSLPEAKRRTIEQIDKYIADGMDKKLAVDKAMKEYREYERQVDLAGLKEQADEAHKSTAFDHFMKNDMTPEQIANRLKLEYKPQTWTVDSDGRVVTGTHPQDKLQIQDGLDRGYAERINPTPESMKGEFDNGQMQTKINKTTEEKIAQNLPSEKELAEFEDVPEFDGAVKEIGSNDETIEPIGSDVAELLETKASGAGKAQLPAILEGKMKKIADAIFPAFMGNKAKLTIPVVHKLLTKVSQARRESVDTINDFFGGSGSWGMTLSAILPNIKQINIYEYNPLRAIKIYMTQTKAKEVIEAMDSPRVIEIAKQALAMVVAKDKEKGASWGGAANYIDGLIQKQVSPELVKSLQAKGMLEGEYKELITAAKNNAEPLSEAEIAALQFLADIVDRGARDLKKFMSGAKTTIYNIGKYSEQIQKRGIKVRYFEGSSYGREEYDMGENVLNVFDPPYYKTSGYNGVNTVGIGIYRMTHDLVTRFADESKGLMLYRDELWHYKKDPLKDTFDTVAGGGMNAHEMFDNIVKSSDWVDTEPVAGRTETIWFKDGSKDGFAPKPKEEVPMPIPEAQPIEQASRAIQTKSPEVLPNQKAYEATAKIVGFDNDIAALAKVTPELTEPYARVVAGEASEADYKSLLDSYRAVDGNEAWQGIRAEARGLDDPKPIETVEPKPDAQMSALESEKTSLAKNHEPIDPKEADEILQAMYYAPSSFYKEFGIKGSTLEKLTQAIESGTMTPEQHKLYSDIKEFVTESGGLSKYRAEHAEMIDNRADNDALGEYLAEMRDHQDTIEAEYRQINKIVRKQLVSMGDSDIEETLRGMGIVEKISKAEDMAIDEVTPEWVKVIQPKADKLYEAYKTKEIPELERIHGEALDRLTTLQDRLYTHPTQAKALADKAAIAKTQNEIAKLKAVEWASSGMLRADGVSGIVAGMANGLQYDNDGNITGIDPERFLIGLVGGTMGSAILRGKVGQQALNAAAKKLQPLKDLAINEGNALAAKLHDKIMSSYFAPASFVVPYAESAISKTATNEMPKGFFSQLERVAEDKLPNRFGESALLGVLRNNGVKDEELKWVKVSDGLNALKDDKGNIRKDDFMAYIKDNRYLLTEKENRPTTYEQYTSDGGTDYKEILIQAPNRLPDDIKIIKSDDSRWYAERAPYDGMNIVSSGKNKIEAIKEAERALGMPEYKTDHWKEPNVLMHIRAIDQSKDGDKTLLIEEIQSDWHQEGKSKGYAYDDKKLENLKRVAEQNGWDEDSRNAYLEEVDKSWEAKQRVMRTGNKGAPQAPLSKTWQEYGIKRMIDEAVDGGYDRVAWTTGEVQNKRYDLAKFADEIIYNEKSSVLAAKKDGNEVLFQSNVTPDKLESIIGKEPTRKLMANEPNSGGGRKIAGEELSIGGDGMRGFYDKILPDFTRKYIKKWDSKVEKTQLDNGAEVWSFPVTQTMRDEVKSKGQPLYAVGAGAAAATQYNQNKESTK